MKIVYGGTTLANVNVDANTTMNVYSSFDLNTENLIAQVTANTSTYGDAKLLGVTEGVFIRGLFVKNQQQIVAATNIIKLRMFQ